MGLLRLLRPRWVVVTATAAVGGLIVARCYRQYRQANNTGLGAELGELLQDNQAFVLPESDQAVQVKVKSWGVQTLRGWLDFFGGVDRANAWLLSVRTPDLENCPLVELVRFLNQAGLRFDLNILANHQGDAPLRQLAQDCINLWEYERYKLCMRCIKNAVTRSRAQMHLCQLMPATAFGGGSGGIYAANRLIDYIMVTLLVEKDVYVHRLPDGDREHVESGEMERNLIDLAHTLDREVRRVEQRRVRLRQRAQDPDRNLHSIYVSTVDTRFFWQAA